LGIPLSCGSGGHLLLVNEYSLLSIRNSFTKYRVRWILQEAGGSARLLNTILGILWMALDWWAGGLRDEGDLGRAAAIPNH